MKQAFRPATPAAGRAANSSPAGRLGGQWWWWVSGFWLLMTLASWLEYWLFSSLEMTESLRYAALQRLPWMLISPPIIWLSFQYPLERGRWRRTLWIHLLACGVVLGVLAELAYLQGPPPFPRPAGNRGGEHGGPAPRNNGPPPGNDNHENHDNHEPGGGGPGPGGGGGNGGPGGPARPPNGGEPGREHHGHGGTPPSRLFFFVRLASFQLPTFWAVLGVAHAFTFYQRAAARERRGAELEAHLTQARLEALRMQLNPHFLFNTLNSIASLVHDDPAAADGMIGSLSELLRLSLNASDRQEVTLREELHFLDQYLHIEQARFGDRLRVEKDLAPAALDTLVPILILQPLVENAVKHGLESRLAPGVIAIAASQVGDALRLQVADNGRGLTPGQAPREGVGLGNTRSRLRELYGPAANLTARGREGGGFLVEIILPWRPVAAPETPAA